MNYGLSCVYSYVYNSVELGSRVQNITFGFSG